MWLITCGHPAIAARFFVAIDCLDRICLVDEAGRALRFATEHDAERFARLHGRDEDWSVSRI